MGIHSRWIAIAVLGVALSVILSVAVRAEAPPHWAYSQSTGELRLNGELVGKGYSGIGEGLNNPDKENVSDVGPIPAGAWTIGDASEHPKKGPITMRLAPLGHEAHGRDGFLIHGDNKKGDQSASNGCIILSKELRQKIAESPIKKMVVTK